MTTRCGVPRAATWLRQVNPSRTSHACSRHVVAIFSAQVRQFITTPLRRQSNEKLDPPPIPDLTHRPRIDLNEFLGSPGWKIDDLLPPSRKPKAKVGETSTATASAETTNEPSSEITSQTLHHLLQLSALPAPSSHTEEENLLSALHDQLHFVKHVQSVTTDNIPPLSRIGYEPRPDDQIGVLTYEECVAAAEEAKEKVAVWKQWNVTGLTGGSRIGRELGYFAVVDKSTHRETEDEKKGP